MLYDFRFHRTIFECLIPAALLRIKEQPSYSSTSPALPDHHPGSHEQPPSSSTSPARPAPGTGRISVKIRNGKKERPRAKLEQPSSSPSNHQVQGASPPIGSPAQPAAGYGKNREIITYAREEELVDFI